VSVIIKRPMGRELDWGKNVWDWLPLVAVVGLLVLARYLP